jgi:hypothetical protein
LGTFLVVVDTVLIQAVFRESSTTLTMHSTDGSPGGG